MTFESRRLNTKEVKRKRRRRGRMRLAKRSANAQIKRILVLTTRQKEPESNRINGHEMEWNGNRIERSAQVQRRKAQHLFTGSSRSHSHCRQLNPLKPNSTQQNRTEQNRTESKTNKNNYYSSPEAANSVQFNSIQSNRQIPIQLKPMSNTRIHFTTSMTTASTR